MPREAAQTQSPTAGRSPHRATLAISPGNQPQQSTPPLRDTFTRHRFNSWMRISSNRNADTCSWPDFTPDPRQERPQEENDWGWGWGPEVNTRNAQCFSEQLLKARSLHPMNPVHGGVTIRRPCSEGLETLCKRHEDRTKPTHKEAMLL